MRKPKLTPPETLLTATNVTVTRVRADFGDFEKQYDVITFGPRAGIVALTPGPAGEEVLLVGQYRFLPNRLCWEIPGGRVEPDEDPAAAAIRECREETGILCHEPEQLAVYYPGLDNVDNRTCLFVSHRLTVAAPFAPDPKEVGAIRWVPVADAARMVFEGEILDGLSVVGLLAYLARGSSSSAGGPSA